MPDLTTFRSSGPENNPRSDPSNPNSAVVLQYWARWTFRSDICLPGSFRRKSSPHTSALSELSANYLTADYLRIIGELDDDPDTCIIAKVYSTLHSCTIYDNVAAVYFCDCIV